MKKYCLYIVLTRTNTVISRMIQIIKNDEYTHASISLDRNLEHMYSFGRKYVHNPFIGIFRHERINEGLYKYQKTVPSLVMEIEVTRLQYEKARSILEHFINNGDIYKYNYMGLLHSLLNKSNSCYDRFLCSEFVYYVLNESGIADLNIPRNLVRPQSLLNLKNKLTGNIIYTGDLKKLRLQKDKYRLSDVAMRNLSAIY